MTFTVHERGADVVFVHEGRNVWGFVFGGFWLMWHGAWILGPIWLAATFALQAFTGSVAEAAPALALPAALLALVPRFWLLLEGGQMRRWSLARRGYSESGVIEAENATEAETVWAWRRLAEPAVPPAAAAIANVAPRRDPDTSFGLVPVAP